MAGRLDAETVLAVRAMDWYQRQPVVQSDRAPCGSCTTGARSLLRQLRGDAKAPGEAAQPAALEARYRRQLVGRVRGTHKLLMEALKAALAPLAEGIDERAAARGDAAGRADGAAGDARKLIAVVRRVERAVKAASPIQQDLLLTLAEQVAGFTSKSVTKQVSSVIGVEVLPQLGQASALLEKWAKDNVALIKSLDSRYFEEVRQAILTTVTEGHSTRALSKAISGRFSVARSRADLIATDQVGTLNAEITQERQTQLGIESYIWSSSGDSRVRPLHEQLNGTTRRWDDPHPTEGHPGMPIRCRCTALPVL